MPAVKNHPRSVLWTEGIQVLFQLRLQLGKTLIGLLRSLLSRALDGEMLFRLFADCLHAGESLVGLFGKRLEVRI